MVSVVIPTHNRCDLLQRAIKSVQSQSYTDLEIIIVSDGSTDETEKIVGTLADLDHRIRLIAYHPAKGGNTARNIGIEAANGEYIAFLDDDDEWLPEKIEKQLEVMKSDPEIGLVYTGVQILYVNEVISYNTKARNSGDMHTEILLDNFIGTTSTVMLKKDILPYTGMFDINLRALQDYDLWIRVCQKCRVGVVPEELIRYYNYTGTNQISSLTQKYIDAFQYIDHKYEALFSKLSDMQKKEKTNNEYLLLTNKALRNGDGALARKYAVKALRSSFSKKAIAYYILSFFSYKTTLKLRSKF